MLSACELELILNPAADHGPGPAYLSPEAAENVRRVHEALPEYRPTPLVPLPELAEALGIRAVYVKDESGRFGLKAFKGLGGIYALFCLACERLGLDPTQADFSTLLEEKHRTALAELCFVTATDGNHGKGVAWAAGKLGCRARVYMPRGSSPLRAQAIREAGRAEVTITPWCYDDTVRYAAQQAREPGCVLVQDTSWPGYEQIPRSILQGYSTMAREACDRLEELGLKPSHVFLQAGVGAMPGGVLGYLRSRYPHSPLKAAVVEPEAAACIFRSFQVGDGEPHTALGSGETIMAGLNCGTPCTVAWPILRDQADASFSCPDWVAADGMRLLRRAGVTSGESGASTTGLAAALARVELAALRGALDFRADSVLLLFSTEGDTEPDNYRRIVEQGFCPNPFILMRQ